MTELSVIIPAFDEETRVGPTLEAVHSYLSGTAMSFEVVVVDDGSRDRTRDIVREIVARLPGVLLLENGSNRGKGYSVRNGFLNSSGRLVLFSDADLSTPIEEIEKFLPLVETGADMVIGSRAMRDSDIVRRQPLYRMMMGKTFNKLVRLMTVRGISDTQCGFKLFRRSSCERIFLAQKVERFAFDVELLFLAGKAGLTIAQVPVRWINSPQSKVHILRDSARMLLDIIRVRWDYFRGAYDPAIASSSR